MKTLSSCVAIFMIAFFVSAQSPFQLSQYRCWGGNNADIYYTLKSYNSQMFMLGGTTRSTSGFISANYGDWDGFVTFFDHQLNAVKTIVIGGNGSDEVRDVIVTEFGTILLLHTSNSTMGNYVAIHGEKDACLQPYDYSSDWYGQLKFFGGAFNDELFSISKKNAGGYLLAGYSMSSDGDLSINYGSADAWILNLSPTLNINWSKSYGGSNYDYFTNVYQLPDGNIIAAGNTYSDDGMVHNHKGGKDVWVVKLNSMGDTLWTRILGGSGFDELVQAKMLDSSRLMLIGYSNSIDGDFIMISKSDNNRVVPFRGFVYIIDEHGQMQFKALIYHAVDEYAYSDGFALDDQKFIAGGLHAHQSTITAILSKIQDTTMYTEDYDFGVADYWVNVLNLGDGNMIMSCVTISPAIPQFQGLYDVLLMKIQYSSADVHLYDMNAFIMYPNPAYNLINLNVTDELLPCTYFIHASDGKIVSHGNLNDNMSALYIEHLPAGQYYLSIQTSSGLMTKPFMKF